MGGLDRGDQMAGRHDGGSRALDDEVDDLLGGPVGDAQVDAHHRDESKHDSSRLCDLTTVGPLHTLKLGPAGTQEGAHASADRLAWATRRKGCFAAERSVAASVLGSTPTGGRLALLLRIVDRGGRLRWNTAGSAHERGVELVDVSDVIELTGQVLAHDSALSRHGGLLANRLGTTLPGTLAVTCH